MIYVLTLFLVLSSLIAVFRFIPISEKQQMQISYVLLMSEIVLAIAFYFSPRQAGDYCAGLAHYHWPVGGLLAYLGLFLLAVLLLQQYSRWWAIGYLGLVAFPLSLGGWMIQDLCAGNTKNFIEDSILFLILYMTFPLIAAVWLLIFLGYFSYISWHRLQLLLPSIALFGLYLLFLEHAMFDWISFVVDF